MIISFVTDIKSNLQEKNFSSKFNNCKNIFFSKIVHGMEQNQLEITQIMLPRVPIQRK